MNSMALWHIFPSPCSLNSTTELRCIHRFRCREILRPSQLFPTRLTASRRWPFVFPHTGVLKAETARICGSRASSESQQSISIDEIVRDVASEKAVEGPKEVRETAGEARKKIGEESIGKVEKEADEASEAASEQTAVEEPKETRAPFARSSLKETAKNSDSEADDIVRDVASETAVEGPKEVHETAGEARKKIGQESIGKVEKEADEASEAASDQAAVEELKETSEAENVAPSAGSTLKEMAKNSDTEADDIIRDVASEMAVEGPKEVRQTAGEARKKIGEESIGKVEKVADEASEAASEQAAVEEPKETREAEASFAGSSLKETAKNSDTEADEIVREGRKEVHDAAREAHKKARKESLEELEKKADDFSEASSGENLLFQKAVEIASDFAMEDPKEIHHEALKKAEDIAPLVGRSLEETAKDLETKAEEIADEESEALKSDLEDDSREAIHRYKTKDQEGGYKEDVTVLQDDHGNGDYGGEPRADVKSREEVAPNQGAQIHDDDSPKSTIDAKTNEDQKSRAIQDGSMLKEAHSSSQKIDSLVMDAKRNEDRDRERRENIPILQKAQSYDAKIDKAKPHDEEIDKSRMDANKTEDQERGDTHDVPTSHEAQNRIERVENSRTRRDARRPSVEEVSGNVREAMERWQWAVESVIASGTHTRQQLEAMKGAAQKRARGFGEAAEMVREVCTKAAELAAESWGKAAKHSEEVREVIFRNWEQLQKNMEQKTEGEGDRHVIDAEDHSASSHGVDEGTIEAAKETGKANGGNSEGIEEKAIDVELKRGQ